MMARQLPNNTSQAGIFVVGTPSYVDVDGGFSATDGRQTFASAASNDAWSNGDTLWIRVEQNADPKIFFIAKATWDSTNEFLLIQEIEDYNGTLGSSDHVTVSSVLTRGALLELLFDQINSGGNVSITSLVSKNAVLTKDITTARVFSSSDNGKIIEFSSSSNITFTFPDTISGNAHCVVVKTGSGNVNLAVSGSATINGGTSPIVLNDTYSSAYIYQSAAGAWVRLL